MGVTDRDGFNPLHDGLLESQCAHIVIDGARFYWKPVFNILKGSLEVGWVNPFHVKVVLSHKTDIRNAERLAAPLARDLVRPLPILLLFNKSSAFSFLK
jgi:hypothetical protein